MKVRSRMELRLRAFGLLLADDCLHLLALPAAVGLPLLHAFGAVRGAGLAYAAGGLFVLLLVFGVRCWAVGWFVVFSAERDLRAVLRTFEGR